MRIGIIGAGPAGTICALTLLRGASQCGQQHEILLFDGKSFERVGPQGCNMCAGVIADHLLAHLTALGAAVPPPLIQRAIRGFYLETPGGGAHIPKDPDAGICTVFRSAGPRGEPAQAGQGFDNLLLRTATAAGATHIPAMVIGLRMPESAKQPFRVQVASGAKIEVDVVVGAFGMNSTLGARFEQLGFGYRRPQTYQVCQAELPLDEEYIEASFRGEVKIFSLGLPGIRFGALTPKRRHVTVTIIGPHLSRADLEQFVQHPAVRRQLPTGWALPAHYCHCHPQLPVTTARHAVTDRLMVIGDAHVSRYLKGGIASSFFTGSLAAEMILRGALSRGELWEGYVRPCHQRYCYDNLYGRLIFRWYDVVARTPWLALAALRTIEREQSLPPQHRCHTQVLWHIFAGDAPYAHIARDALRPCIIASVMRELARGGKESTG